MHHSRLCLLILIYGLSSQMVRGRGLSHDEITTVSNLVREAATNTEYLFEAGDPEPSKNIPAFDRLRKTLTERHATDVARLLETCESPHQRYVLFCAFQWQTPSCYMGVLENSAYVFSAGKMSLEEMWMLCFPHGVLEGVVPYNYQNKRVIRFLDRLERSVQTHKADEDLRRDVLKAIPLIRSGQMREALLADRNSQNNLHPFPILP